MERQWKKKKSHVMKWKPYGELTYLGAKVSAGGGCEAAVTAKSRCVRVKLMKSHEMLYGRRFPPKLKGSVYKSHLSPSIPYGSEAQCLKESEIRILQRTERSMVRAMC